MASTSLSRPTNKVFPARIIDLASLTGCFHSLISDASDLSLAMESFVDLICSTMDLPPFRSSKSFLRFSRLRRASGFLSRRMISVSEARKTEFGLMTALLALKFATRYCLYPWSSATRFPPEMPGPETMTSSTINAKLPRGPEIRLM